MTREECVTRIAQWVRVFGSERKRTPRDLYAETGYETYFEQITQEDIEAVVAQDPGLVDDWVGFTEDKRWTPAWGLAEKDGSWLVFRYEETGWRYKITFNTPQAACALMIRMEMEDFRLRGVK